MKTIRTKFDNDRGQMLSARLVLPLHHRTLHGAIEVHLAQGAGWLTLIGERAFSLCCRRCGVTMFAMANHEAHVFR